MSVDLHESLSELPLFSGLSSSEIDRLQETGRVEYYAEGTNVLAEGEAGVRMVVILDGTVSVLGVDSAGDEVTLSILHPGDVFGEMCLLLDTPRSATVRARDDIRVFAMDRPTFEVMVNGGDPAALKFGMALARVLAKRVSQLNKRLLMLVGEMSDEDEIHPDLGRVRKDILGWWGSDE